MPWIGPKNQGLWRFQGIIQPVGGEILTLEGSVHTHQLLLSCPEPPAGSLSNRTAFPTNGLWNVVTTPSNNKITPETLGYLLQMHMQYHGRMGFNGTILRCNKGEAQSLSVMPRIEALVTSRKLIVWPWVRSPISIVGCRDCLCLQEAR